MHWSNIFIFLSYNGFTTPEDVDLAVLEPDGQISVRRVEEAQRPVTTELPEQSQQQSANGTTHAPG
jgi:uncharacterized membrane protein YcaP (DUF421 family)